MPREQDAAQKRDGSRVKHAKRGSLVAIGASLRPTRKRRAYIVGGERWTGCEPPGIKSKHEIDRSPSDEATLHRIAPLGAMPGDRCTRRGRGSGQRAQMCPGAAETPTSSTLHAEPERGPASSSSRQSAGANGSRRRSWRVPGRRHRSPRPKRLRRPRFPRGIGRLKDFRHQRHSESPMLLVASRTVCRQVKRSRAREKTPGEINYGSSGNGGRRIRGALFESGGVRSCTWPTRRHRVRTWKSGGPHPLGFATFSRRCRS